MLLILLTVPCFNKLLAEYHPYILLEFYTCFTHFSQLYVWPRHNIASIKNSVGCRDDTVLKTVDTRRHCEEE